MPSRHPLLPWISRAARSGLLALLAGAGTAQDTAPRFVPGDVASLSCRVLGMTRDQDTFILTVEVRNRGRVRAEPLVFAVTAAPHGRRAAEVTQEIARVGLPYAHRAGRPIAPGGRLRYRVYGSCYELPERLAVEVRRATFFEGDPPDPDDPPVDVGAVTQHTLRGPAGTLPVTRVELTNRSDRPVDLLLRARFSRPRDVEALVAVSLAGGERRDHAVESLLGNLEWGYQPQAMGAKVEEVELADWCLQYPQEEARARQPLLDAYVNWLRWDRPLTLEGEFTVRHHNQGEEFEGRGRFTIDSEPGSTPQVTWSGPEDRPREEVARILRVAFADLRRPTPAAFRSANRFARNATDEVAVVGSGWRQLRNDVRGIVAEPEPGRVLLVPGVEGSFAIVRLDGGRIVAERWSRSPYWTDWDVGGLGSGYVVTSRADRAGDHSWRYGYQLLEGLPVVTSFEELWKDARDQVLTETVLQLDGLQLTPGPAPAGERPPRGPGLTALRQAWNNTWSYPDDPVTLRARFEIENPATDGVWLGHQRITGSVVLEGFRGFRLGGERWRTARVEIDDDLPRSDHPALANAVLDRFGIWAGRDPAGRGEFDAALAGAELGADRRGVFAVDGGSYRQLVVKRGLLTGFTPTEGTARTIRYAEVAGRQVPTRIRGDSGEELRSRWREVDGYLLPVEFEFREVFGPDWGPETVRLREVRIER